MWRNLALAGLALSLAVASAAATGRAQSALVSLGVAAAPAGGVATVPLQVSPDPQVALGALTVRIAYDAARLQATSASAVALGVLAECNLTVPGEARCSLVHATGMSGLLLAVNFQVQSSAPAGAVGLSLAVEECFDVLGRGATCTSSDGAVLVQAQPSPPPPPSLVAIRPLSSSQASITWLPPSGVTHYVLRSALNFEMTFGLNETGIAVSAMAFPNLLVVGVPGSDGLTFYYQLAACNQAGCSPFVRVGGLARRIWPGAEHWNFYLAAYDFLGTTMAAAFNTSPVPNKASLMTFYDGIQGFGAVPRGTCPAPVQPGLWCELSWTGGGAFVSGAQSFPPYGEVGAALRLR